MMETVLIAAFALAVTLFAIVMAGKAIGASREVKRELRSQLEREGWSSLGSPFFALRPGFRGSWQGREARGYFRPRHKSRPPALLIEVSTRQFERVHIARAATSRLAALGNISFGLPPRVDTGDERFDARAASSELIAMILRDESTSKLLEEFLRSAHDGVDSKGGTLKLHRELLDRKAAGSLFSTLRPSADEVERSVFLSHRLIEALSTKGF